MLDQNAEISKFINREPFTHTITCLDVSPNGEYIMTGHINGHARLWDLKKGSRINPDIHAFFTESCINLKFVPIPSKFQVVYCGSGGKIKIGEFKIVLGFVATMPLEIMNGFYTLSFSTIPGNPVENSLLAFADENCVRTINLSGKFLWEFERPADKTEKSVPYLACNNKVTLNPVGDPKNPNSIILAVSWGKSIYLLKIKSETYEIAGVYQAKENINFIGWLEDSVLSLILKNSYVQLIYVKSCMYASKSKKPLSSGEPVLEQIDLPASEFLSIKIERKDLPALLSNEKTNCCQKGHLFRLTSNSIIRIRLKSYEEYLSEIRATKNLVKTALEAYRMFSGKIKGYKGLSERKNKREKQVKEWLKDALVGYFKNALTEKHENLTVENIRIAIELCLMLDDYEFLLNNLYKQFEYYAKTDIYNEALEPFLMARCFKHMTAPKNFLESVIKYYKKPANLTKLETAVICLKPEEKDFEFLSSACQENRLYTALFYLCTLNDDIEKYDLPLNVVLPILKYGDFKETNEEFKIKDLQNPTEQILKSKRYLVYKVLWYIDMCLHKKKYSGEPIFGIWKDVVNLILSFLVRDGLLKELIKIEPETSFKVLINLFENDDLRSLITMYYNSPKSPIGQFYYMELIHELSKIVIEFKENSKVFEEYLRFLCLALAAPNVKIPHNVFISAATLIKEIPYYDSGPNAKKCVENELFVLSMLERIPEISEENFKELEKAFENSPYIEIQLFLFERKHDLIKALDLYINSRPKRVFEWLDNIHRKYQYNPEIFAKMQNSILDHLEKLVFFSINTKK